MIPALRNRFGLVLAAMVALSIYGCTEGDVLRVIVPASPCGRSPDPDLVVHRPLWGRHQIVDAVWAQPDLAVAVGTGGMTLAWRGERWEVVDAETQQTFTTVAARHDGEVCAAGSDGILARWRDGAWETTEVSDAGAIRRLAVDEDGFWACGDRGTLVRITDAGIENVDPPHDGDLFDAHSDGDTLWVLDATDTLRVRVDRVWSHVAPARLAGKQIRSLAPLPDGRLVALADSLYVRDPAGWILPNINWWYEWRGWGTHLRSIGGDLWYLGGLPGVSSCEKGRYRLGDDGWERYGSCDEVLAPWGSDGLLTFDRSRMTWQSPVYRHDPAGYTGSYRVVAFLDGMTCFHGSEFGFEIGTAAGMVQLDPESARRFYSIRAYVGESLGDHYAVAPYGTIWRVLGQEVEIVYESAPNINVREAAALGTGDLLLFTEETGVLRFREGVVDTVDGRRFRLHAAGRDLAVATLELTDDVYFVDGNGVTPTGLDRGIRAAGFLPDGRPVILAVNPRVEGSNYGNGWWTMVASTAGDTLYGAPARIAEECGELVIEGGTTGPDGFYVWSEGASLVYRLAGDPLHHEWTIVAGPFEDEINRLAVQADGSLIAESIDRLIWHPGAP